MIKEEIVKISGYTFTFTPSLRCLAVQSPTGGLEIIHVGVRNTRKQESEAANEIAMNILYRQDVTKAGLTTNPLNVATHHDSGSGKQFDLFQKKVLIAIDKSHYLWYNKIITKERYYDTSTIFELHSIH